MSKDAVTPYDWLKSIPSGLIELDEIPLVGYSTAFPWQKFIDGIVKQFELDKFSLVPGTWKWLSSHELFEGIDKDPIIVNFGFSGYEGHASIAINKRDLDAVIGLMIAHRALEITPFDPSHQKAFLDFLMVALCDQFSRTNWEKGLQIFLSPERPLSEEHYLTLDVQVDFTQRSFPIRIYVDNQLRQSWKEKHLPSFDPSLNPSLAQKIEFPISIEAGYVEMLPKKWQEIHLGDLLLLDSCTIDETFKGGSVLLRLHHLPYFKAQLNDGNIILEEQPSYHEIESAMAKDTNDDTDFDFDDESQTDDSTFGLGDDSDFDFSEESDILSEVDEEATAKEETAKPAAPAQQKASSAAQQQSTKTPPPAGKEVEVAKKTPQPAVSPKDIPLYIGVEVGRFQVTLEKMMELQPGNMLSLHVRPEDGVDLVVNGRRIGRGELLRFGETLGVRITEIG